MPRTKPPTAAAPLQAHLGFWLRAVSNQVSARFQGLLEARGVTVTEWVALRTLFDEESAGHAALIGALGMTKGAASKIISRLEDKGLARRQAAEGSGREQALALTPAGRALVPRLAALADANDAHFFGHLPEPEREQLMQTLRDLATHHGIRQAPLN